MHMVCFNTTSRTRTAVDREARVHRITKNCKWEQLKKVEKMMKTDRYQRLRDGALKVNGPKLRYRSALDTRDSTKTSGGVLVGFACKQMYDAKRLERMVEEMTEYTVGKFVDPCIKSMARIVVEPPAEGGAAGEDAGEGQK